MLLEPGEVSRRSFLRVSAAAAAATQIFTEPMLARAAAPKAKPAPSAVHIDSNENPLGPSAAARAAAAAMVAEGGRYNDQLTEDFEKLLAQTEDVPASYVRAFPGSSNPLHFSVMAFSSPQKCYVTADPGYEAGMHAADAAGARVVKLPLTKEYAHDVKAMLDAAPDAGLFYVCTPNNPTGTLTSHSDIEQLVEKKPKDAIVLVDEAYLHFCDAPSAIDLVKADKDVIVLRTFSKLYGMAGLRCGFAVAKPELLERIEAQGGWNAMPVTAVAAAMASLKEPALVAQRKRINAEVREQTFHWLTKNGITFIPSQSNCFMLDTMRQAGDVIAAMAKQDVVIGRVWPIWPTWVRITVGTQPEMDRFQTALGKVMSGTVTACLSDPKPKRSRIVDGAIRPA